jgi:UDP-glucose 4-epimerase
MRALVTGCAGFVGSHLTESLLNDGHEVVGVDCFNDNYARRQKLDNLVGPQQWETFEFVPIDLSRGELEDLVDDCEVIFHLAAEPGVRSSWGGRFEQYLRNNLLATQRLLETAKAAEGRKRVVYASSSSVYGHAETLPTPEDALPQPFSPYGVTKLGAEEMCSLYWGNHGLETVSLRFFTVYGPRQRPDMAFNRFCHAALTGAQMTVFGDGEQTRDFTYVADIVSALRSAAVVPGAAGRVYNVGGGSRVSVNDALRLLAGYAGRPLDVEYLDNEKGDVRDTGADTTRARAEIDYDPQMTVANGLLAEFEWVREMVAAQSTPRRHRHRTVAPIGLGAIAEAS